MASAPRRSNEEARYLVFQVFTGTSDPRFPGEGDRVATPPVKDKLLAMAKDLVDTIGTTGDAKNKLGFALGPIAFDHTDEEVVRLIKDGFAIAKELDLAVAFHIDDSMFWGRHAKLWKNPENIEWLDWRGKPNTGRRIDWGPKPTRLKPQMCFNSPAVVALVRERAQLMGSEVAKELESLEASGRGGLYAGFVAGWETQLGRDFATGEYLGYCGLANKGFSSDRPPKDIDYERTRLVKEFIDLWTHELVRGGVPEERLYSHIVFTVQGLDDEKRVARASYEEQVHFSTPDVAFGDVYDPGFSTYPSPGTFAAIYEELQRHGNPPWASAEGTNIIPNGVPGERNMETYLGRMFNHGAVLVNIFSWGLGGEAERERNMFRQVTERPEALAAYRKFLRGETLIEDPPEPLSLPVFRAKIQRIQRDLPAWVRQTRQQDKAEALMKRLDENVREGKLYEANAVADEVLALIETVETSSSTRAPSVSVTEFRAKVDRIMKELPPWVQRTRQQAKAESLMKRLEEKVNSGDLEGANKVADEIIALIDSK